MAKAESNNAIQSIPAPLLCNPLEKNPLQSSQRPTDTIPMRTIHHECQAAIREITAHIQTREQLDVLLSQVDDIACVPKLILVFLAIIDIILLVNANVILQMQTASMVLL